MMEFPLITPHSTMIALVDISAEKEAPFQILMTESKDTSVLSDFSAKREYMYQCPVLQVHIILVLDKINAQIVLRVNIA
jgi:hypothetical protein